MTCALLAVIAGSALAQPRDGSTSSGSPAAPLSPSPATDGSRSPIEPAAQPSGAAVSPAGAPSLAPRAVQLSEVAAATPPCAPARKTCLGLRLHVPVTEAGAIAAPEWVARQVASANTHFAPLDVAFQVIGVEPLPASAERVEDKAERISFGASITKDVIDVFVTGHLDDIDRPGEMIYGVTWWTTGDRKFVILSTQAWERTLAHELGHVFGLKHSRYRVSIMNKRKRTTPPVEERTFHRHELAKMKPVIRELVRGKTLKNFRRA